MLGVITREFLKIQSLLQRVSDQNAELGLAAYWFMVPVGELLN